MRHHNIIVVAITSVGSVVHSVADEGVANATAKLLPGGGVVFSSEVSCPIFY